MDQIIPGLWLGSLRSAQYEDLEGHGIRSILSAMRGRLDIQETFIRHQVQLDDSEDADILMHFLPSIHFIQAELDKGHGVLVHCQGGVSRSASIVAAYLMYSRKIDPQEALQLIKKSRPAIDPNSGFRQQLEIFHAARYKITTREKSIRMYYMGRAVEEVMNGDGTLPETNMFAEYPRTPSDSLPGTSGGPRRRIRCKMCRQELATREHMLDHGQLGPATPAATTPAGSRRSSTSASSTAISRKQSGSLPDIPRRSSRLSFGTSLDDSLAMSSIQEKPGESTAIEEHFEEKTLPRITSGTPGGRALEEFRDASHLDASLSRSALEIDDENENEFTKTHPTKINLTGAAPEDISIAMSQVLGRRLSDALTSSLEAEPQSGRTGDSFFTANENTVNEYSAVEPETTINHPTTHVISPVDLAAELYANPKLTTLRSPPVSNNQNNVLESVSIASAPILANAKCSGYFLEPMKWMEHFLSSGQLTGKITCPNKKCNAKLGNFDWAGVCCGCKEWVTPGFCINRSKVDEVI